MSRSVTDIGELTLDDIEGKILILRLRGRFTHEQRFDVAKVVNEELILHGVRIPLIVIDDGSEMSLENTGQLGEAALYALTRDIRKLPCAQDGADLLRRDYLVSQKPTV